jgi:hypothetical protein
MDNLTEYDFSLDEDIMWRLLADVVGPDDVLHAFLEILNLRAIVKKMGGDLCGEVDLSVVEHAALRRAQES